MSIIGLMIKLRGKTVKRIVEFGKLSVNQQLDMLEAKMESKDVLLFQFYENKSEFVESQESIDEYFKNYCDDVIYYYNPKLQEEIKQAILSELVKNLLFEDNDISKKEETEKLYYQMKRGEYKNISEQSMTIIKRLVFRKITKYNKNGQLYKYINERIYGESDWIFDERGKVYHAGGAIWCKPADRKESLEILQRFPLFSCIILKEGESLDEFLLGYVVIETASNYDLLIFENH